VNTTERPQFHAIEERVIGINEPRRVYNDFLNHVIPTGNMVPNPFLELAEKSAAWPLTIWQAVSS
jgi:hypothetical protein